MRVRSTPDFLSGLLFCATAIGFMVMSSRLELGTPTRIAVGFFPMGLSIILLVLGTSVLVGSLVRGEAESLGPIRLRPLVAVIAGVLIFSFVAERWGFAIAGVLLISVSRLAIGPYRRVEVAILAVLLVGVSAAIFLYGLKLPLNFLPG